VELEAFLHNVVTVGRVAANTGVPQLLWSWSHSAAD